MSKKRKKNKTKIRNYGIFPFEISMCAVTRIPPTVPWTAFARSLGNLPIPARLFYRGEKYVIEIYLIIIYTFTRPFTVNRLRPSRSVFEERFFTRFSRHSPNRFAIVRTEIRLEDNVQCGAHVLWSYNNLRFNKTYYCTVWSQFSLLRVFIVCACLSSGRCSISL